jgi:antitoxin component YwqK of YwqJK toxin-antitoxin module
MATTLQMAHESPSPNPSGWLRKFIAAPLINPGAGSLYTLLSLLTLFGVWFLVIYQILRFFTSIKTFSNLLYKTKFFLQTKCHQLNLTTHLPTMQDQIYPAQTLTYPNGKVRYFGYLKNGQPDIFGKIFYENGLCKYEGTFYQGIESGKGKAYGENGNMSYEGEFLRSKAHGIGKIYSELGEIYYEGNFVNGEADGYGQVYRENGMVKCSGDFWGGKLHG